MNTKSRPKEIILSQKYALIQSNGSQSGFILPPKGHLTMSGNILCCHNWEVVLLASRDNTKHPVIHRMTVSYYSYPAQMILRLRNHGLKQNGQHGVFSNVY